MKKIVLKHTKEDKYIHNCLGGKPTTTYSPKGAKGFKDYRGAQKYMKVHDLAGKYGAKLIINDE